MKKILPLINPPPITCYQYIAFPLSIILVDDYMRNWFYNNYIQILSFGDDRLMVSFYDSFNENYPLEIFEKMGDKLDIGNDIIDFFEILIRNKHYIYLFCDNYYIRSLNKDSHVFHDILIYGYDHEKQIFNIFVYNNGYLSEIEVSYSEILKAYNSEYVGDVSHRITIYKRKNIKEELNIKKFKWHFLDYLEGVDTFRREDPRGPRKVCKSKWGINVYDSIINLCEFKQQANMAIVPLDIYCFYEHKKVMIDRIKYFCKNTSLQCPENILNELDKLYIKIEALKGQVIRLVCKKELNYIVADDYIKIITLLKTLKKEEEEVLHKFYNYNNKIFNKY